MRRELADKAGLRATSVLHLIVDAETVTLESLRRIAAGVSGVVECGSSDQPKRVRLLSVHRPDDDHIKPPEDRGVVAGARSQIA